MAQNCVVLLPQCSRSVPPRFALPGWVVSCLVVPSLLFVFPGQATRERNGGTHQNMPPKIKARFVVVVLRLTLVFRRIVLPPFVRDSRRIRTGLYRPEKICRCGIQRTAKSRLASTTGFDWLVFKLNAIRQSETRRNHTDKDWKKEFWQRENVQKN